MSLGIENIHRSNHSIIFPQSYGSPLNDITKHISGLGLRRLDFERCAVAVEGALLDRKHVLGELPDFKWRYESLWVLLWALGHMEDLGAPASICDVQSAVRIVLDIPSEDFIQRAKSRPIAELRV